MGRDLDNRLCRSRLRLDWQHLGQRPKPSSRTLRLPFSGDARRPQKLALGNCVPASRICRGCAYRSEARIQAPKRNRSSLGDFACTDIPLELYHRV